MKPTIEVPQTHARTNVILAIENEGQENPKTNKYSDTPYAPHSSSERTNETVQSEPSSSSYDYKENYDLDNPKTDIPEIVISLAPKEINLVITSASEMADFLPSPSTSETSTDEKIESPTSSCLTDIPIEESDYTQFKSELVVFSSSDNGQKTISSTNYQQSDNEIYEEMIESNFNENMVMGKGEEKGVIDKGKGKEDLVRPPDDNFEPYEINFGPEQFMKMRTFGNDKIETNNFIWSRRNWMGVLSIFLIILIFGGVIILSRKIKM